MTEQLMPKDESLRARRITRAIGFISIILGAFTIMFYSFGTEEMFKQAQGAMLGHSALIVGGIIMLMRIPLHPRVNVNSSFARVEFHCGAIFTAIISVGLCFMLWGLYNMFSFGYTEKRMLCLLLGLIPLLTVMLTNSRTVPYITTLWKISMSLSIGIMLIPFVRESTNIMNSIFIMLTLLGHLFCIWLIYIAEPYLVPYLSAREASISEDGGLFRSRKLYTAVTFTASALLAVLFIRLSMISAVEAVELPAAILGMDSESMMKLLTAAGGLLGGALGWWLAGTVLRNRCQDCSKYTFTVVSAAMSEILGISLVYMLVLCGRCFAAAVAGLICVSLVCLMFGYRSRRSGIRQDI